MPGYLCTGVATDKGFLPKESRAYSEGIYHRAAGTAAAKPKTDNPHAAGSSAHNAWDAGWDLAHAAATTTITASDAPCVAVPTNTILA